MGVCVYNVYVCMCSFNKYICMSVSMYCVQCNRRSPCCFDCPYLFWFFILHEWVGRLYQHEKKSMSNLSSEQMPSWNRGEGRGPNSYFIKLALNLRSGKKGSVSLKVWWWECYKDLACHIFYQLGLGREKPESREKEIIYENVKFWAFLLVGLFMTL